MKSAPSPTNLSQFHTIPVLTDKKEPCSVENGMKCGPRTPGPQHAPCLKVLLRPFQRVFLWDVNAHLVNVSLLAIAGGLGVKLIFEANGRETVGETAFATMRREM